MVNKTNILQTTEGLTVEELPVKKTNLQQAFDEIRGFPAVSEREGKMATEEKAHASQGDNLEPRSGEPVWHDGENGLKWRRNKDGTIWHLRPDGSILQLRLGRNGDMFTVSYEPLGSSRMTPSPIAER